MSHTLCDMKETLKDVVTLDSYVRYHPWVVTASAVAAGFVAGAASTLTSPEAAENRRAQSEQGRQPTRREDVPLRKKESFLGAAAGTLLLGIARTMVQHALTSPVKAEAPTDREDESSGDPVGTCVGGPLT